MLKQGKISKLVYNYTVVYMYHCRTKTNKTFVELQTAKNNKNLLTD